MRRFKLTNGNLICWNGRNLDYGFGGLFNDLRCFKPEFIETLKAKVFMTDRGFLFPLIDEYCKKGGV
jgi:hypothetical protein